MELASLIHPNIHKLLFNIDLVLQQFFCIVNFLIRGTFRWNIKFALQTYGRKIVMKRFPM